MPDGSAVAVIAHRGLAADAPENTVAAIERSAELGVDGVEVDLRVTADGHLVVMHDETVDRTTDGRGRVDELTLDEVMSLDAGSHAGRRFRGERVPTLATVLQTIASTDLHVLLDIKDCPDSVKRDALALVERMALAERVILGPRTLADLGEFTAIDRGLRTLALVPGRTDLPPDFSEIDAFVRGGADMVRLWPSWILTDDDSGAELVARVHRRGKSVWTCADTLYGDISADDPVSDFRRLVGIGVAGIMTNLPSVLQPIVADVS